MVRTPTRRKGPLFPRSGKLIFEYQIGQARGCFRIGELGVAFVLPMRLRQGSLQIPARHCGIFSVHEFGLPASRIYLRKPDPVGVDGSDGSHFGYIPTKPVFPARLWERLLHSQSLGRDGELSIEHPRNERAEPDHLGKQHRIADFGTVFRPIFHTKRLRQPGGFSVDFSPSNCGAGWGSGRAVDGRAGTDGRFFPGHISDSGKSHVQRCVSGQSILR